ncbi:MAG: hypothetical protein U0401_02080 [Anaerolineae bacterium]
MDITFNSTTLGISRYSLEMTCQEKTLPNRYKFTQNCKGQQNVAPSRKLFAGNVALIMPSFREGFACKIGLTPTEFTQNRTWATPISWYAMRGAFTLRTTHHFYHPP